LSVIMALKQSDRITISPLVLVVLAFAFCGALSTFSSYIELLYKYATEYNFYKLVNLIVINHLICILIFLIGLKCSEKYLALSIS
jgi:fluoride ion exporter CrcB/FEX